MSIVLLVPLAWVFPGLAPGLLWGGLAAASLLTVLLYLLRLQRRPVVVPYLALWQSVLGDAKATAWRSQLRRLLSLLLSLLIVAALFFALSDPSNGKPKPGRSVVVLVDVSASMARQTAGVTALARARKKVASWLGSFVGSDRLLIVEMGAVPRPLGAFTHDRQALRRRLDELSVLDVQADLPAALIYARDILRGRSRPQIVLLSDGALGGTEQKLPEGMPPISFESVAGQGQRSFAPNLKLTSFSARRYPSSADRYEVLVEAQNAGDEPAEVELLLSAADEQGRAAQPVELLRLTLPPGQSVARSVENLAHAEEGLVARLSYADQKQEAFVGDNVARTLLAPRPPVSILVVGEPNTFLDAALLIEESFEVRRVAESEYPPDGQFDLTLFDGVYPQRAERTGAAVYLGAPSEAGGPYPLERGDALSMFGFDTWDRKSAVFDLIDPYDVQVLNGFALQPEPSDRVLARSQNNPILVSGVRPEGPFLALGFAPTQSDFVLRTVWPLFVVNLVNEMFPRGRDALAASFSTTGWARLPLKGAPGDHFARLVGPLDEKKPARNVPLIEGQAVIAAQRVGFYEATTAEQTARFAVSLLGSDEGDFSPSSRLTLADGDPLKAVSGMEPNYSRRPWFWLIVAVLIVSYLEWWSYHRRWTV